MNTGLQLAGKLICKDTQQANRYRLAKRNTVAHLSHVPLARLKDTSAVEADVKTANDVCAQFYSITVEGREITLQYGVYTNDAYRGKHQQDHPAECAEYAAFWVFTFDGEKLLFNRHQVAG
jgi:hypothetical protein